MIIKENGGGYEEKVAAAFFMHLTEENDEMP